MPRMSPISRDSSEMSGSTLYEDDVLLWSEQQAEAIRRLGTRRDLPNELDIENVAEEIESVGRSELAAVNSHLRLILGHLMKLVLEPDSGAARHWRGEIVVFHSALSDHYAPSMRQHVDLDELWARMREQAILSSEDASRSIVEILPIRPPFALDDFIAYRIDSSALVARLRPSGAQLKR